MAIRFFAFNFSLVHFTRMDNVFLMDSFVCVVALKQWEFLCCGITTATNDGVVVDDDLESCSLWLGRVGRRQVGGLQLAAICREVFSLNASGLFWVFFSLFNNNYNMSTNVSVSKEDI